jgi:hypothetical protein
MENTALNVYNKGEDSMLVEIQVQLLNFKII